MARISTYIRDTEISANDIVIGSEYNGIGANNRPVYTTKNYRMFDLQEFFRGGDFTASSPIVIEIDSDDGHRNWKHAAQPLTKQDPNPGITLYAKDNYGDGTTSNTPHIFSAITSVTTNTTGHLTNYTLTEFTMPEEYSFIVTGDDAVDHSNTGTNADSVDQTINFEQTLTISGGDAWISTLSSNGNVVSIYHNYVTRTDVAYVGTEENFDGIVLENDGIFTVLNTVTSDTKGHVTGSTTTKYTLPDYKFNIAADSTNPNPNNPAFTTSIDIHSTSGTALDTLSILASAPISSIITANDTITISHDEVSALIVTPATAEQPSFGGNFIALKSVDRNSTGHLTHSIPVTITIPDTVFVGSTAAVSGGADASGGSVGLVPAPASTDILKFLRSDSDWADVPNPSVMGSGTPASYAAGLVLAGSATHGNNFLRKDGSWATVTQTSITSSNGTFVSLSALSAATGSVTIAPDLSATGIGANTAAKQLQFLRGDNTWATPPGTFSLELASSTVRGGIKIGYVESGKNYPLELSSEKAYVNVPWVNTWNANAKTVAGYVSAPGAVANKVWKTDASGNPAWRTDADTTYSEATSSSEGLMSTAHHDKLDDIEDNATADQTAAQLRTAIGTGNGNLVPAAGTAGHFLKHDGTFGLPSYTTNTDTNTTYSANSGVDLAGTVFSLDVTSTSANSFFQIPFFNSAANALSRDISTSSSIFFNPNSNTLSVKQISIGTTSVINTRSIFSQSSNTSGNYFEIRSTMTNGTGGSLVVGVAGVANRIYSYNQTGSIDSSRNFEIVTSGGNTGDFIFGTNGNMTVSSGDVTADNFIVSSDKRLKSEIKPIKEGLEVIKQFTSYNYIKSGKKESGFIAQEVQEVLPHTVYENKEGMLSMSDRGVVAHMHKAILELEKRLILIEEKLR